MSTDINNILVGFDGFDRDEAIPALAIELALEHQAQLHVLNVLPEMPHYLGKSRQAAAEQLQAELVEGREKQLESLLATAREKGLSPRALVRCGSPHIEIIREAMAVSADLLIVSDEPVRRYGERGFGTVTTKLLRECPCPVLAKRNHRKSEHKRILAAVDVEPGASGDPGVNHLVMDLAASLARRAGSELVAYHAWSLWGEHLLRSRMKEQEVQELLGETKNARQQSLERLVSESNLDGIEVEVLLTQGEARHVLPETVVVQKIDLVVMGTLCRAGVKGLLIGNTAERVLNALTCSVLAVKPEGFQSPVEREP